MSKFTKPVVVGGEPKGSADWGDGTPISSNDTENDDELSRDSDEYTKHINY